MSCLISLRDIAPHLALEMLLSDVRGEEGYILRVSFQDMEFIVKYLGGRAIYRWEEGQLVRACR